MTIYKLFCSEEYKEYYRYTYKSLRDSVHNYKTYDEMINETFFIYKVINKIIKIYKNDK